MKLHKTWKDVSLEDHEWDLEFYDFHDKTIVIFYHWECQKYF